MEGRAEENLPQRHRDTEGAEKNYQEEHSQERLCRKTGRREREDGFYFAPTGTGTSVRVLMEDSRHAGLRAGAWAIRRVAASR